MSQDDAPSPEDTDALDALDRFLDELRREFRSNPEFAYRAVRALGAEVTFEGKLAAKLINPLELVATKPEEIARAQLVALTLADLKALAKSANLATPVDMKGKDKDTLADMILVRAKDKVQERHWKA